MGSDDFHGVLIADRYGDLLFLNEAKLNQLPADPESVPGFNEASQDYDFVAKQVYSH